MEDNHHIEWIEIITKDRSYRKYLRPKEDPETEFEIQSKKIKVRVYCNIHGLWKS